MSGELGIAVALLTLGSCFASYQIGRMEEKARWQELFKRRRERLRRWEEFPDED